jgi:peptidoglycan/LPS O-acetylase OafA/YrhL
VHYIPKIDGCRAFAVLAVLGSHYFPEGYLLHDLPLALWGVQLFFVLSGYLITSILLKSRDCVSEQSSKWDQLRIFYIRRVLRIFPAYYALLIAYVLLGVHFEGVSLTTCLLYVFNLHQSIQPGEYEYLGHLWTLCIEEQFYMIWPWLMLFLPRKMLVPVTLSLVLTAPLSRLLLTGMDLPYISIRNLPTSQLDSLCGGALLALFQQDFSKSLYAIWKKHSGKIAAIGIAMTLSALLLDMGAEAESVIALLGPALVSMFVVHHVSLGNFASVTGFLNNSLLRAIGKISYGVYLYQFLSLFVLYKLMTLLGNPGWLQNAYAYAFVWALLTLALSTLSWHCYEAPISRLKRWFNYRPSAS